MNTEESFSDSAYADEMHLADRELSAFIIAVTEWLGPAESGLAAEDWLEESELMDSPLDRPVGIGERSQSPPRPDWLSHYVIERPWPN